MACAGWLMNLGFAGGEVGVPSDHFLRRAPTEEHHLRGTHEDEHYLRASRDEEQHLRGTHEEELYQRPSPDSEEVLHR